LLLLAPQAGAPFITLRDVVPLHRRSLGLSLQAARVFVVNHDSDDVTVVDLAAAQPNLFDVWRLGSGLGESLTWALSQDQPIRARLSSTTAPIVAARGERAGLAVARAVYALPDRNAPYTVEVRLKPALESAGAIIRKDQYDLIMNILNTLHPIGVEFNTRRIREHVVEVSQGLLNAFPDYTYPNYRVRGPAPRRKQKE
jgi:hypothetical protein